MKKLIRLILILLLIIALAFIALIKKDIPVEQLIPKYANQASQFVDIDGMKVHYRIEGEGKPIVLIHGTGSCLQTWDVWTDSLKKNFKVIRLDMPGFGLTGPRPDKDYSIQSYVNFLDKFMTNIHVDTFMIAGNSLGGQIAWNYAHTFPQKISKMILLDPGGFINNGSKSLVFKLAKEKWIANSLKKLDTKLMVNNTLKEVYFDDSKISEQTKQMYYDISMRDGNRQSFIDRVQEIKHDAPKDRSVLNMPTLILWGKEDVLINVALVDSFKMIPNNKIIIYDKVGHSPQEEIPTHSVQDAIIFINN